MPMYREPHDDWVTSALLFGAAVLVIGLFYAAVQSRPEMKEDVTTLTSATAPALDCDAAAQLVYEGATEARVVADAPTLDRIATCLRDDRARAIALSGVKTVGAAQDVAAALEGRGVPADELHRVTFAHGVSLCEPADWDCWRRRDVELAAAARQ
jgi:hypothetical protein